jgi:hypothetical protein
MVSPPSISEAAMRHIHILAVAVAAATLASVASAAGTVQVSFVQPERFADVRDAAFSRDANLDILKRHLEAAAAPYVADGATLKIDVLDVDLAGEPSHGPRTQDLRILRGRADWPRIQLRYSLEAPGQPARAREATVSDMAYLQHIGSSMHGEALYYERRMLDEWFKAEFRK